MAHYTVAVFHKKNQRIEKLLMPYVKKISFDPDDKQSKREVIQFIQRFFRNYKNLSSEECWKKMLAGNELDQDGLIYIDNPDAKWDWWSIGSRWNEKLTLKNSGKKTDEALVKDVDFSPCKKPMRKPYKNGTSLLKD